MGHTTEPARAGPDARNGGRLPLRPAAPPRRVPPPRSPRGRRFGAGNSGGGVAGGGAASRLRVPVSLAPACEGRKRATRAERLRAAAGRWQVRLLLA